MVMISNSWLGLRVHRAISWLGRAEKEADDADVRFILLWIGFNSAYGSDVSAAINSERGAFAAYFAALVRLDVDNRIQAIVWKRFHHEIRMLLENKYVFAPFWKHHNSVDGYDDWRRRLAPVSGQLQARWRRRTHRAPSPSYSIGYTCFETSWCTEARHGTAGPIENRWEMAQA